MEISYEYGEMIERLEKDIHMGKKQTDTIYVKRKPVEYYKAIIDYGYEYEPMVEQYGKDIEKSTVGDIHKEMLNMNEIIHF